MTSFSSHLSGHEVPIATPAAAVHVPPEVEVAALAEDMIETATDLGLEVSFEVIDPE